MTVLCGDTEFTGYTGVGPIDTDGGYLPAVPFVAVSSGQVTSLNCWITPTGSQSFVMGLYDGLSQQIVYSASQTVSTAGLTSFPIAPTPIKQFQAYSILLIAAPGSGQFQFGVDVSLFVKASKVLSSNQSFPATPPQLTGALPTPFGAPAFFADGDTAGRTQTTSGTSGVTFLDNASLISRAFNRCKIRSAVLSDEMLGIAREELFLFLTSDLANRGEQLFAVDTLILPLTAGLSGVQLPAGTIEILNADLRMLNPLQVSGAAFYNPQTPTQVNTVGITWSGPAVPIQIQMSPDGANWATLATVTPNASAGDTTMYDLDGGVPSGFWRVIANPVPPGAMLLVSQVGFYSTFSQVPMASYSRDDYANLSNPFFSGRPYQYWLDRQEPWPIMRLWPVPGSAEQANACLVIWRHKQIEDVGTLDQRLAIPVRWLSAVIDGLAYRLSKVINEVNPALVPMLKADAAESLNLVRSEERERAPMRLSVQIRRYTR